MHVFIMQRDMGFFNLSQTGHIPQRIEFLTVAVKPFAEFTVGIAQRYRTLINGKPFDQQLRSLYPFNVRFFLHRLNAAM
jgi:hypothetical protein